MTHPSFVTNGASLEDCHTNFFALADLCGIKWRRLCADSILCVDPLDDPVLSSYSKCLAAGILCVWRRVASRPGPDSHRPADTNQLSYNKELWIFWYGEEPDLSGLVSGLTEGDQGSLENGLSYESRTLLFKAFHNLIERCLLSRGFTRLGKWFLQPLEPGDQAGQSIHFSFSFKFFIHGESTVCTAVDVRQHPAVYRLTRNHLFHAQSSHSGLAVILSPYGMAGSLTGQSYKETDSGTQRLLGEWRQFYPLANKDESSKDCSGEDDSLPCAVEVIVGGVKMRYPSSYVLIADIEEATLSRTSVPVNHVSASNIPSFHSAVQPSLKSGFHGGVLTPPTSPRDPSAMIGNYSTTKHTSLSTTLITGCQPRFSVSFNSHIPTTFSMRSGVWQDSTTFHRVGFVPPPTESTGVEDVIGQWNFSDPCEHVDCSCYRCKNKGKSGVSNKSGLGNNSLGNLPSQGVPTSDGENVGKTTLTSTSTANASRKGDKCDKERSQARAFRGTFPFHKRNQPLEGLDAVDLDSCFSSRFLDISSGSPGTMTSGSNSNIMFNYRSGVVAPSTPCTLPHLNTTHTQPSSVDSAHPGTPTPSLLEGPNSQDPTMPTLSPHPPHIKEEYESQDQVIHTHSPAVSTVTVNTSSMRDKPPTDQVTSPYHTSLSVGDASKTSEGSPATTVVNHWSAVDDPVVGSQPKLSAQGLKRPVLPFKTELVELEEEVQTKLLYDFCSIQSVTWDLPANKRRKRTGSDSCCKQENLNNPISPYPFLGPGPGPKQSEETESLPAKPKDPYEFNVEFEEYKVNPASSGSTFRVKMDIVCKEEEKPKEQVVPAPTSEATVLDQPKSNSVSELSSVTSPLTPRTQGSSFTKVEHLQLTGRDLENIFDSCSSDDSNGDLLTPGAPKMINSDDQQSGKSSKNNTYNTGGILGAAELATMFPTPPSLEHLATPSPSGPMGGGDITTMDGTDSLFLRDRTDIYPNYGSPGFEPVRDWSYVYKRPTQYRFVSSSRYAPLNNLPSSVQPIVTFSSDCIYKPGWPHPPSFSSLVTSSPVDRPSSRYHNSSLPLSEGEHLFTFESDQRSVPMNYELQSPASNASSYLNKHLNSIDNSTVSSVPEAHSLLVNLVLSDSMFNLFKDHNFSSCTLCVCNMNIKGADTGIYLLDSMLPFSTDEPQYKCTCGFSAVVNRHLSYHSGLFYEDEVEVTGVPYEPIHHHRKGLKTLLEPSVRREVNQVNGAMHLTKTLDTKEITALNRIPHHVLDMIRDQCQTIQSAYSWLNKAVQLRSASNPIAFWNHLELMDQCHICFLALDSACQLMDNINNNKLDERLKSSCLHKWPSLSGKLPASDQDVLRLLRMIQPLLQEAVQKKIMQGLFEVAYTVSGPLTWRQFHRLAGRGTEDQCEPQPIPTLLVGSDKDCLALSPYTLKFWDKLLLEPYSLPKDVAYIVVAPDNEFILSRVRNFFRELSSIYELCKLGRHSPITKVLRDGIMRVGKSAAKKLADEPVDEWFNMIGDSQVASKLKLYAQACRHHLAPFLAAQSLDCSLLANPVHNYSPSCKPSVLGASPLPPGTPESQDKERASTPKPQENDSQQDGYSSASGNSGLHSQDPLEREDEQHPPALVIYIIEPFTYGSIDNDLYRLASVGLLRCYTHMLKFLPEHIKNNIHLQMVRLDSLLCLGKSEAKSHNQDELKALAFSVFSQCPRLLFNQPGIKSLTGFGPAASKELFVKTKDEKNSGPYRLYSPPFILAPMKDKQTELGEMFGDRQEKSNILFCTYCLVEDQRWLVASCTNDKGELLETCSINVEIPNRTRRKKASSRGMGLHKLLNFLLGVMSSTVQPWRLVVGRLGRLGHGELKDWAALLSRRSLLQYSRHLWELCRQCAVLGPADTPCILSACLVSLEPDSALRIMPGEFTPDDHFSSSCHSCDLSTPEDASCTHILVFPTSATAQSTQAAFHQEHIEPLGTTFGDDDIFQALNDDDINVGPDINDLFRWTESPTQSPVGSPRRDSASQLGSPSGVGGRHSPFPHGGVTRSSGSLGVDAQEEPLQLLQQPLALGYYVSTAQTGPLPSWFWSPCPHLKDSCPVFLKSALLIHSPAVQQSSEDLLHSNPHIRNCHPLDSNLTTDVLRYVLEGYNALSWLSLDPVTHDRRSCLPVHIQILMQLCHVMEAVV
ncbi:mediator of RNA polymerase II transcription subunit 13-like isoform X2 [Limulus polyphemus]|uniref:Mediator of RNA polymerase II transcription subunit 13 n=1 Tax=Limulus polyphemus TaxID=6850 RepID=A0ABM1SD20_LIMPO|nr:mediator of RNA polymerase II transcription subunit 13-like isoform X2 [Limulus polyphemus]